MDATFEDVVKRAEQLTADQQNLLIYRLRLKQIRDRAPGEIRQAVPPHRSVDERSEAHRSLTREDLIREAEILRQTPARPGDSLLGKYANPNAPEISEGEFHAMMHAIVTEWENELDELSSDDS